MARYKGIFFLLTLFAGFCGSNTLTLTECVKENENEKDAYWKNDG
jgi:hypothetical protein